MKVAITGSAGFIGSNLVERCLSESWTVVGIDDFSTGFDEMADPIRVMELPGHYMFVKMDINDTDKLTEVFGGCDTVFHLAALPRVSFSIDHPMEADHANTHGTLSVLEAARRAGVRRIVFSCSSSVYGGVAEFPTPETSVASPKSPYALHKQTGAEYCRLYSELHGLDTISLLYFNVFGKYQRADSAYATVIPAFFEAGINGAECRVDGDGEQSRDFCITKDAKVLLENLTWVTPDKIKPGSRVISFDEHPINKKRRFCVSSVDKVGTYKSLDVYEILFQNGNSIKCTGNHPWLTYKGFKTTDSLYKAYMKNGNTYDIKSLVPENMSWDNYNEKIVDGKQYDMGYVVGTIEGDGSIGQYVDKRNFNDIYSCKLSVTDKEFADYYFKACKTIGVDNNRSIFIPKYPGAKVANVVRTNKRKNFHTIYSAMENAEFSNRDFSKGYLAAIFDGEGEYHNGLLRISNSDKRIIKRIKIVLDKFGFKYSDRQKTGNLRYITVLGGLMEHIRFFSVFQNKILRKRPEFGNREVKTYSNKIMSIKKVSPEKVFVIEVANSHTYITNGLLCHNCHVDNVVQANILAATSDKRFVGDRFNIACGDHNTVNDAYDMVCKMLKVKVGKNYAPPRLGDPRKSHADIKKAKEILGYNPEINFEEGMKLTSQWWLSGCPVK